MKAENEQLFDGSMTVGYSTTPEIVAASLDILYMNRDKMQELAKKGKEKFLRPEYDWKNIAKQWSSLFEEALNDTTRVS